MGLFPYPIEPIMTQKRRNRGRSKKGRGHVNRVVCCTSGCLVPKDKAIVRYVVRNIVETSALSDMMDASVYDKYAFPKMYFKNYYSISAAVHSRIVHVRSREDRRIRTPPPRYNANKNNNNNNNKK